MTEGPPRPLPSSGTDAGETAERDDAGEVAAEDPIGAASDGGTSDDAGGCPEGSVLVETFCIDQWEASLVEVFPDGREEPYPHWQPVDGHSVRAVSRRGAFPQTYISEVQAAEACEASGKRLCSLDEWKAACMGPSRTTYPYGAARASGTCQDNGRSAVGAVFGAAALAASTPVVVHRVSKSAAAPKLKRPAKATKATKKKGPATKAEAKKPTTTLGLPGAAAHGKSGSRRPPKTARPSARPSQIDPGVWARLNDPRLGQVEGTFARSGERAACTNEYGVFDMMGNAHEWVAPTGATHGTFAGGYFLDTSQNGEGCLYKTQAHAHDYHDYSTGFRCCADR